MAGIKAFFDAEMKRSGNEGLLFDVRKKRNMNEGLLFGVEVLRRVLKLT